MGFLDRIFAAAKDTIVWAGFDLQRGDKASAQAVVLIDPSTGDAYSAGLVEGLGLGRGIVSTAYMVKSSFIGASVGDVLTCTQFLDVSGIEPTTLATIWRNQSAALDLVEPPLATNIEAIGSRALTNAELRATPLPVEVAASIEVEVKNDVGTPVNTSATGLSYVENSVGSVTVDQANGTTALIAVRSDRRALIIVPPVDCNMRLTPGDAGGVPLYGGVPNSFVGAECPTNAIFVYGLTAGQSVTIWEA